MTELLTIWRATVRLFPWIWLLWLGNVNQAVPLRELQQECYHVGLDAVNIVWKQEIQLQFWGLLWLWLLKRSHFSYVCPRQLALALGDFTSIMISPSDISVTPPILLLWLLRTRVSIFSDDSAKSSQLTHTHTPGSWLLNKQSCDWWS